MILGTQSSMIMGSPLETPLKTKIPQVGLDEGVIAGDPGLDTKVSQINRLHLPS